MVFKNLKQKNLVTICIVLTVITICSICLAYNNQKKYTNLSNNSYYFAFYELIDYMEDMENYLAKSLVTKEANHSVETLNYIWREANLAQVYLAQLPIYNQGLSNTAKFLNQVSEYSYTLSRKCVEGKSLQQEDLNHLKELYNYSVQVNETLGQIAYEVDRSTLHWKELEEKGSSLFAKESKNPSKDGFDHIEQNFKEYDGLIYDGAYSEHITNVQKKGLTGEYIDESKAKQIAINLIEEKNIKTITNEGLSENGTIPVYTFMVETKENNAITIAISQKGGHIVFMNYNRLIQQETMTVEEASQKAEKFLAEKGYQNMKQTYSMKEAGIVTINYAYQQENVIIYPDLIKVKVALDNGDILGFETTGYLNNHETRKIDKKNIITEEKAAELANENIKIESTKLAMIPTEFKTEIFCWELKGTVENRNFLLYVNAKTGKVEDILVIIQTEKGTLTQ